MYQHNFLDSFDLGLLAPDSGFASNVPILQDAEEGSSIHPNNTMLEKMMHSDKEATLSTMAASKFETDLPTFGCGAADWLEQSSDWQEILELSHLEEVKAKEELKEDPAALIVEMEEFLSQFEDPKTSLESDLTIASECPLNSTELSEDDKRVAEQMIDDLFTSTLEMEEENSLEEMESQEESGYSSAMLQTSEVVMEDGTKVIFVIAPDFDEASVETPCTPSVQSEMSPNTSLESEDESWSPETSLSLTDRSKRKAYERKPTLKKTRSPVIDKKERKKLQNVEAARRYRDKKKNEQLMTDVELDELMDKNKSLKQQVAEKETELKTLKKLMIELGIISARKK